MNLAQLNKVAEAMVAPGRGILAADELSGTSRSASMPSVWNPRPTLGAIIASCCSARPTPCRNIFRASSSMTRPFARAPEDGTPLVKLIEKAGSLPGIKVDKGTKPLPFSPGEVITEGLDGLRERLIEYRGLGAKFAKWRAVIDIGPAFRATRRS